MAVVAAASQDLAKSDLLMIWQPKTGQWVKVNYKNKSMPWQDSYGIVRAVGHGRGPKNVLVETKMQHLVIVPRGNLNADN